MPVTCSKTVLSGVDGSAAFAPAGTRFCLLDKTDFAAGSKITMPLEQDFMVGDPVTFAAVGAARLDTALTAGTTYYVLTSTKGASPGITVSATIGGTAITLTGSGGVTGGDTPEADKNHITIKYASHAAVCQVQSWTANLSREEVDTTSLQCGPGTAGGVNAPFRTRQAGYVDGSGSMVIRFTRDQTALSRRMLRNSLRKNQDGASVQLFIDTIYDATGKTDAAASTFIEGAISILGFSLGSEVGSTPTEATVNFSFADQPTNIFGAI